MTADRMPNFAELEQRILQNLNNSDYGSADIQAALTKGEDPYRVAASKIFGVSVSEVTKDQRRYAKTVEFLNRYASGGKP